jgi:hypothetical protein
MLSGPDKKNHVPTSAPVASAALRPNLSAVVATHQSLPDTVVDRDCFVALADKTGGLFTILDLASFQELAPGVPSPGRQEIAAESERAVKALTDSCLARGIDLAAQPVGFALLTVPPGADAIEIAAARTELYTSGACHQNGRALSLDLDGDTTLAHVAGGGTSILVLYDLSKLKKIGKDGSGTTFAPKEGIDLPSAFLGELTLVSGGRAALTLELARYDTPVLL